MELDPLNSKDLNYGVPPYFNKVLDDLLDDSEAIFAVRSQSQGKLDPNLPQKKIEQSRI